MNRADELLTRVLRDFERWPGHATGIGIVNDIRAYLNEKPHEMPMYPSGYAEHLRAATSPPHAAAEPEKPMDDDLPGVLAVAKGVAEQKWPHTMDAAVWAREWIARTNDHPDVATDEGAMIGWFANAIMAGHDTAQARGGSYKEGWKDCVKAHDGLYPPHAEFQSPAETPLYASPSAQPIARLQSLLIEARGHLRGYKMSMLARGRESLLEAIDDELGDALKSAGKE